MHIHFLKETSAKLNENEHNCTFRPHYTSLLNTDIAFLDEDGSSVYRKL